MPIVSYSTNKNCHYFNDIKMKSETQMSDVSFFFCHAGESAVTGSGL